MGDTVAALTTVPVSMDIMAQDASTVGQPLQSFFTSNACELIISILLYFYNNTVQSRLLPFKCSCMILGDCHKTAETHGRFLPSHVKSKFLLIK